jgi:hypothetical protein
MTCAFADWSQRRFPVESGRTAAVSFIPAPPSRSVAPILSPLLLPGRNASSSGQQKRRPKPPSKQSACRRVHQ